MPLFRDRGAGADPGRAGHKLRPRTERAADGLAVAGWAPLPILAEVPLLPLFPEPSAAATVWAGQLALSLAVAAAARRLARGGMPGAPGRQARWAAVLAAGTGLAWAGLPALLIPLGDEGLRQVLAAATVGTVAIVPAAGPAAGAWLLAPVLAGTVAAAGLHHDAATGLLAAVLGGLGGLALRGERRRRRAAADTARRGATAERSALLDLFPQDDPRSAGPWFWATDEALRLRDVSPLLAAVAGWPAPRLEGKSFDRLFLGPAAAAAPSASAASVLAAMNAGQAFRDREAEHRGDDGGSRHWRLTGAPVRDGAGRITGYRGVGWDVTALHDAHRRIDDLHRLDPLTGLATGEAFRAAAVRECAAATADGSARALLHLDLDDFKGVNTAHGHAGGDALLRQAARRIAAAAPRRATVARLGADAFAILYAPSHAASAGTLARTLKDALRAPFDLAEGPDALAAAISIDASIGIALAPDHGADAETLMRHADLALTRAKAAGKGRTLLFAPAFAEALVAQHAMEADIRQALARGEFALHYQPLFDLAEGRVVGMEALLRWTSPTRGPVSPAQFIPVAEASGLIVDIGRFVLTAACRTAAVWATPIRVAVNISPRHLRRPDFMADVTGALTLSGLPATRLEVEITEGVILQSDDDALAGLHALRSRGIRVALDDFGTGYSSLNYLTNFPVDKIKIDRAFVRDLLDRHENRAVVDAILTLARKLGLAVTAEGVETPDQALALKIRRCTEIQGFLMSPAQPAAAVEAMVAAVPAELRAKVPALFESPLAAVVAMRRRPAA